MPARATDRPPGPLAYPAFRALFAAQILSLLAIGLLTMGLALAAYAIGGTAAAGRILGLFLALKMIAYVGLAPFAETLLAGRPRKPVLIGLDLARMLLLLPMALADETWQLAALAFAFFAVSAAFTPLYQATIPDLLPETGTYTRALALSRVAYTLEAVLSPVLATALLQFLTAEQLFPAAALAFVGSILALARARIPPARAAALLPFRLRALKGLRLYTRSARLRGLLLVHLALSMPLAWVLVNGVAHAGLHFADAERQYPLLMAGFGVGSALGALLVPRLLERTSERRLMLTGVLAFAALAGGVPLGLPPAAHPGLWAGFGLAASLVLTPGGLVLVRASAAEHRPAVFAAHFSLSHAGWLLAYPLAGWLAAGLGLATSLLVLAALGLAIAAVAARIWPPEPATRQHAHPDLPRDHPHLVAFPGTGPDHTHRHPWHPDPLHGPGLRGRG